MNICKLASLADLERFGTYDYAVPMNWLMEDPEKRRPHFWWYPSGKKRGTLWGRPLKWAAVARMALWKMRREVSPDLHDFLQVWAFAYPGKALDALGEALVRKWIERYPEETAEYKTMVLGWEFEGLNLPLPRFLAPDESAPSKAA